MSVGKPSFSAIGVEAIGMTMRFGRFTALDNVSLSFPAGGFHALLGENGAGKSTLVKCITGFYRPTDGELIIGGRQVQIDSPRDAAAHGVGMVYQHFTLAPSLTGEENLVVSRSEAPTIVDWKAERRELAAFMSRMPFRVPLDRPVRELAAGEKQKLEIVKQLYLGRRFLILDEPTSVLTLAEADEMLGLVRAMTERGELTALMISHKFREVTGFADTVAILRRGKLVGSGRTDELSPKEMAAMMIGDVKLAELDNRVAPAAAARPALRLANFAVEDRTGLKRIEIDDLVVRRGEILGVAGISGNGQKELAESLAGQRPLERGRVQVDEQPFRASRAEMESLHVRFIPEEPLHSACAPRMSVAENLFFRDFDRAKRGGRAFWLSRRRMAETAARLVADFRVRASSLAAPVSSLSGGNVQRAVLARELTGEFVLLVVSNPCFGLDFSAVAEILARIMRARNQGAGVLLISEDLDELLELSDRIVVMSGGRIAYETPAQGADIAAIGAHMAGHAQ